MLHRTKLMTAALILTLLAQVFIVPMSGFSGVAMAYSFPPAGPHRPYWRGLFGPGAASRPDGSAAPALPPNEGNDIDSPPPAVCATPVGQLITDTLNSAVLGQELTVQVYLPPCYDGTRYEYPTLYLLQGSGYEVGEWVDDGLTRIANLQMSLSILSPFIVVMPANDLNASEGSKYLDTSGGQGSWEDFIVNELVPTIDQKYSTWKDRAGRAIGGISRGGYWSLEIAFSNPDLFATVGGHSPAIAASYLVGVNDDFSMLSLAKSVDAVKTLRIYLDAGDNDETLYGMQQLAGELAAQHVTYTASVGAGIHDDQYWSDRVSDYLAFYSSFWPAVARAKSRTAGTQTHILTQ